MTEKITIDDLDFYILAHNRPFLLLETIKSVLQQTVRPKQITVLDNESTEDVESIVRRFENEGVKYVKTFGRHGNYLKSKEMASKKYVIRFHDDNLIHPEFIEKMLVALNSTDNISAVTSTFTIFQSEETGKGVATYPEQYKNPKHLLNYFVIMNSPKDFMYHRIRANVYPNSVWISGTPFMAVKTKYFKEYDGIRSFEKFAKADDIVFFLYCCTKGRLVCLTDPDCAFFRMHNLNDTVTDENSLTTEQFKNLTKEMARPFVTDKDEAIWRDFFEFIYYLYPDTTKKDAVSSMPIQKFIESLFEEKILPDFVQEIYRKYPDVKSCLRQKISSFLKKKHILRQKKLRVSLKKNVVAYNREAKTRFRKRQKIKRLNFTLYRLLTFSHMKRQKWCFFLPH